MLEFDKISNSFHRLFSVLMKCGEERKDWKRQEKKKLRKERYKNKEDLTRKSKVCGSCNMHLLSLKKSGTE